MIEIPQPLLYRQGYKYRLERDWSIRTPIAGYAFTIASLDGGKPWAQHTEDQWLHLRAGYCYDGPSGPTDDTPDSMQAAAFHDPFYQAARLGHLPQDEALRERVDKYFHDVLRHDGMSAIRAEAWYLAVRTFAHSSWALGPEELHEAPSGKVYKVSPGAI